MLVFERAKTVHFRKTRRLLHCFGRDNKGRLVYMQDSDKTDNESKARVNRRCRTTRGIYNYCSAGKAKKEMFDTDLVRIIGIGRSSSNRPSRNSSICYRGRTQCNLENTNNPFNSKTAFNTRIYFNPRRSIINSNKSSKNSVFENYANMICSGKSIEKTDRSALRAIHTAFTRPKRSCIEGEERLVRSRNKLVKNRSDDAYLSLIHICRCRRRG
eukprot:TRINITY_DN14950_c0_g1_i2.p1 TRINITY_DN14950_c0_g1~~TRINITY_DN14950_c0_g1_i2.p1  ORF type:complete len:214 (-),score=9.33 TRINITY_DN14950_c0_g1_i2:23-664(-)